MLRATIRSQETLSLVFLGGLGEASLLIIMTDFGRLKETWGLVRVDDYLLCPSQEVILTRSSAQNNHLCTDARTITLRGKLGDQEWPRLTPSLQ